MAIIQGAVSGNLAEVDASNNLNVALPANPAGGARIFDSTGGAILTTEAGSLAVSASELVLYDQVDGAALNTNIWTSSVATMVIAQSGGFIALNSNAILTASTYAILSSIKSIPLYSWLPAKVSINAKVNVQPQGNLCIELGLGVASGTSAPTDFIGFRWGADGSFKAIVNNNGTETTASITGGHIPASNDVVLFDVVVVESGASFFIDDVLVAVIDVPVAQAFPTNGGRQTVFARVYTSGSPPAQAPVLSIGQVTVVQNDVSQNKNWQDTIAGMGRAAYQSPITPFTQNTNHTNSTNPSSAALSNTAAGYTTLGGRYQFAAPSGAVTDFALFGFQVPTGYQLFITNIRISAMNTGAAAATTATILDWAVGLNASAVSLATADSPPTSWAPRRVPLGMQSFLVGDAIGKAATDVSISPATPFVVDGGRFVHVILQVPVGTATGSQVIRGDVMIQGYFE